MVTIRNSELADLLASLLTADQPYDSDMCTSPSALSPREGTYGSHGGFSAGFGHPSLYDAAPALDAASLLAARQSLDLLQEQLQRVAVEKALVELVATRKLAALQQLVDAAVAAQFVGQVSGKVNRSPSPSPPHPGTPLSKQGERNSSFPRDYRGARPARGHVILRAPQWADGTWNPRDGIGTNQAGTGVFVPAPYQVGTANDSDTASIGSSRSAADTYDMLPENWDY